MGLGASILFGRVVHRRLFPAVNAFDYPIYYLSLDVDQIDQGHIDGLAINRFAPLSFYAADHGAHDGGSLRPWINQILTQYGVEDQMQVTLIALPRVMGYVFNPVSFWVVQSADNNVRAVLCEVCNTFGQTHSYLCLPQDGTVLSNEQWLESPKVFHVSPFLPCDGRYAFRFDFRGLMGTAGKNKIGIWIDYYAQDGQKQLVTTLTGELVPMTKGALRRAFWRYPLMTFGAIGLIHFQALKLWLKRQRFYRLPPQDPRRLTSTE